MASRARRQQPGSRPEFPWYSFPRTVGPEIYARWNAKLDWMKKRKVHVPVVVDWHWIGQTGLMEGIEPYLDKAFNSIHGPFVCMGWRRLFEIQEGVYKELVVEFLATVYFARKDGIFVEDNLSFCLGGKRRTLSLADFTLRTHIYLPSEVHSEAYEQYIARCIQITKGFKAETHWNEIENGAYDKGTTQEIDIRSPLHRLLHRLITNTINQRQEGDKCPTIYVFFLWALITPDVYVDLRSLLADFLVARAGKDRLGSPIYGGMLITRLACYFGILDKREAVFLTVESHKPFSTLFYKRADIDVDHGMGGFAIPDDTPRGRVPRRVRQRRETEEEEPPFVPTDDELPMDPYRISRRRFDDNLARSANYTKKFIFLLLTHTHRVGRNCGESNAVERAVVEEEVMMEMMNNERSILLF
ncbi:unnamed protein product [Lactuca virosa]|uniref:Aminotransferase-like plant mobile domain-containing protein n=1 Tax=Lactuca virosa TaxID=75947 RepID=A0AAU9LRB7_9ASTR|nr:unnamed protein product [Lactuca virosa]